METLDEDAIDLAIAKRQFAQRRPTIDRWMELLAKQHVFNIALTTSDH